MRRRQLLGAMAGAATLSLPRARAQEAGYGPLGVVEIEDATEAVVSDDGRTAYVAATSGFAAVDISDPANPTVLAERRDLLADHEHGPMEGIIDIKVDGDRLVVPGPGNPTRDDTVSGFRLYDVSDPAAPEPLAFHETEFAIHNAFIEGTRVYLTQSGAVNIVDVTDDEPATVGSIDITVFEPKWDDILPGLRLPHDVWVQGGTAYIPVWEAGTWIVDATDPASPSLLAHIEARPFSEIKAVPFDEVGPEFTEPPGNHHYTRTSADGQLLAIGKESWDAVADDDVGGPSGIELWDVSTPTEPTKLSNIDPPRADSETRQGIWTTAHNFDIAGGRLYSSWYQGGVKIHDLSDPANPTELTWWRDPEVAGFWAAVRATSDVFVASSTAGSVGRGLTEGLFTFPTEPGEQADPPPSPLSLEPTPSRSPTATPTPTPTPSPTPTATPSPTPTPTESGGQPGFGLVGGMAGIAAGLWWRHRQLDVPEER